MKDEQKGKWMRPSCLLRMNTEESGCAPAVCCHRPPAAVPASTAAPLPVSATCAGPHLAAASYTKTTAAHTYSTAAIARTPTLPWSAGSTVVLSTAVSDVASILGLTRVAFLSSLRDLSCYQCNTRTSDFPYSAGIYESKFGLISVIGLDSSNSKRLISFSRFS